MDDAVAKGHVGVSQEAAEATRAEDPATRYSGLHYLFLLGYLERLPPEQISGSGEKTRKRRERIRRAVESFQHEAALDVNGVLNEATWQALWELASFEAEIRSSRWFVDGRPTAALKRACHLRLFAFGLSKLAPRTATGSRSKDKAHDKDFANGLLAFSTAARLLLLADIELEATVNPTTLDVLFDQDALIERLSLGGATIRLQQPENASRRQRQNNIELASDFVRNAARVELWLFGYDVVVGNPNQRGRFKRGSRKLSLDAALRQFLRLHGGDPKFDQIQEGSVPGWFFGKLLQLRTRSEPDDVLDADQIVTEVVADHQIADQVRGRVKSLGIRLLDGLKRVWRWLKGGIARIVRAGLRLAKTAIANIARYIHASARRIFARVVAATRSIGDGLNFLSERVLRGSDPRHLYISHDKDLDFDVFVNSAADPNVVANLSERVSTRAEIFSVASRIVGELVSFFLAIVRGGISTGWFALLLALTRLRGSMANLRRYSARQVELLGQLDALRAEA